MLCQLFKLRRYLCPLRWNMHEVSIKDVMSPRFPGAQWTQNETSQDGGLGVTAGLLLAHSAWPFILFPYFFTSQALRPIYLHSSEKWEDLNHKIWMRFLRGEFSAKSKRLHGRSCLWWWLHFSTSNSFTKKKYQLRSKSIERKKYRVATVNWVCLKSVDQVEKLDLQFWEQESQQRSRK